MALLMTACSKKTPAETLPVETEPTEATTPAPEYATAQTNGIPAVLETLGRGDSVDIVKSFDEAHYIVKREVGYGLVEKNLVRMEAEPAYEAWTGYAYQNAKVYGNYRLAGEPVRMLDVNTGVQVLDDLGWCCLVEVDGMTGYMKQATVAKNALNTGKSDSGKKTPSSTPDGGNAGQDGGEISLALGGKITLLSTLAPQEGAVSGKAVSLADETQVILGYFDKGDKIPVVEKNEKDGSLTICLDGIYAKIPGDQVQTTEEEPYAAWEGETEQIISVYADRWMLGTPIDRLNAGTVVKVLFELENCYLVEVNGITGYVAKGEVAPAEPEETEATQATEATVPAETKPKKDTTATEPTDPEETEPAETTKPAEATKPSESTEPTSPTEATKPTEPTESTKPSEPAETTKPTEPPETTRPTEPTEPTKPAETTEPTEETTEPTEPSVPETTAPPEWTPPIL